MGCLILNTINIIFTPVYIHNICIKVQPFFFSFVRGLGPQIVSSDSSWFSEKIYYINLLTLCLKRVCIGIKRKIVALDI